MAETTLSVDSMIEALRAAEQAARSALSEATQSPDAAAEIEALRVRFLGKKGEVSAVLREMGRLAGDERPKVGQVANQVRDGIAEAIVAAQTAAEEAAERRELSAPPLDVTLPARGQWLGRRHPVSSVWEELVGIFSRLGFEVASGPEVEGDTYNFEALCMPADHPARDMQDTFYIEAGVPPEAVVPQGREAPKAGRPLLRTHTSPVQIRSMLAAGQPPVRVICPGKVYRRDSDLTHTPMFHQIEGLWVDEGVTMAHLKGTLERFAVEFFGEDAKVRLRPSYFPFTEPSAEVDISCSLCGGGGCRTCSGTGWIEVLGAGMVDPGVLEQAGIDPERFTGFAFGMGIDRLAMLKHRITDLRTLFENDQRFLRQF